MNLIHEGVLPPDEPDFRDERRSGKEKAMEASDRKELRVILDNIDALNDEWLDTFPTDDGQTSIHDSLEYEIIKANKILAKRPRNCDVGTAEEQERRFRKYCETEECNRYRCGHGCKAVCIDRCVVAWAQTPYETQEGAGK